MLIADLLDNNWFDEILLGLVFVIVVMLALLGMLGWRAWKAITDFMLVIDKDMRDVKRQRENDS